MVKKYSHGLCCQVWKEATESCGLCILIGSCNNHLLSLGTGLRERILKLKVIQILNIQRQMLSEVQCSCKRNRMQHIKEKRGQVMSWGKCTECRR